MSTLSAHLESYAELRRALGYKPEADTRLLSGFVRYLDTAGQPTVTVDAALAWAAQAPTAPAGAARLTVLRGFARYLSGFDPACQVPPVGLIRANKVRPAPHIYSPGELAALLQAAATLVPGMWAATMGTLIGLMAATGIRPEEAYRLRCEHVELDREALSIVNSKRGKSRRIPLHATTVEALTLYTEARGRAFRSGGAFFLSATGACLTSHDAAPVFRHLLGVASIETAAGRRRARLGDLRHTFAVSTLLDWHQAGADVARQLPVLSAYLGHNDPHATYWYLEAVPELMAVVARRLERGMGGSTVTSLAPLMQRFFTARLPQQRVSAHTVSSYRDCMRLLLGFAEGRTGKQPARLDLADLDAELVAAFLDHLEAERHNGVGTRNLRLTAVQSLFRYAQLQCPEHSALIARVLAIPAKRRDVTVVSYLTRVETDALVASPDRATALGWRDHLLIIVGVQTGLRVSELRTLRWGDVTFGAGANLYTKGKGRRDRYTPLIPATARLLRGWMGHRGAGLDEPVFATHKRTPLSTDAVADLIDRHVTAAALRCPSLARKKVTPHTLRHTCAMNLLHEGIDLVTIALWLGHSSTKSTEIYLHGDTALKEKALSATAPTPAAGHRYRAPDTLLAFLESL